MNVSRTRSSPWLTGAGATLVVAGIVIALYVAWQMWGTNVVAQRTHRAVVEDVERTWDASRRDEAAASVSTEHGEVSGIVRIPRFGADYAVPLLEGTDEESLEAGFGRFTSGAAPGGRGNLGLAAHRVTHGEPLREMPSLRPGDEVVVETAAWTYTYVLDTAGDALTVPFTSTWVVDAVPRNPDPDGVQPPAGAGRRLLTLTTCSELFNTDDRLVAFGHLVAKERRRR